MSGLRVVIAAVLLLSLVVTGAMAQDAGGERKAEAKVVVVKPAPEKAKECEGKCEECDGSCEGGEKKCSGKCEDGKGDCSGKCGDGEGECPGKCGDGAKTCPATGMVLEGEGHGAMRVTGGAEGKAMLKKALAELAAQAAKLEAQAKALREAGKTEEAEKVTKQCQQLKAHHARLESMMTAGGGAATVRVVRAAPATRDGGCGGGCGGQAGMALAGGKVDEGKADASGEMKKGACGCAGCAGGKARGFLGVRMTVGEDGAVRILDTVPESAAARGGLKAEDVLEALNGIDITSTDDVKKVVGALAPGAKVKVKIKRGDATQVMAFVLGSRPEAMELVEEEEVEEIEMPPMPERRVLRLMGVPGGPSVGLGVSRQGPPMPSPEAAELGLKLHQVRAEAQKALAAGNFGLAAELAKKAHEISKKMHRMNRPAAADAARTAMLERRLAKLEHRLTRIERLLQRIASEMDDDDDDDDDDEMEDHDETK